MEELKKQIIDLCNKSELPLEAILFVTKDVWRDVEATLRAIEKEKPITVKTVIELDEEKQKEDEE